ncbi:MAG: histidine kinase dimerization/phospho-acceptor domain-containing protein [Armatimonadota bacterium]
MKNITVDQIINSLNEPMALIDFDGRIIDANKPLAVLLGANKKILIGDYAVNYWSKSRLDQIEYGIEQTKKKGRLDNRAAVLVNVKNREIPVSFNTALMKDKNDKPYAVLVTVKDMRSLRKNVSSLKRSRNLLKEKILRKKQDIVEANHRFISLNKQLVESEYELRVLFKQIKETQRLKSIYLSGLSEEFYNPLLSITGFTEMLKEKVGSTPETEKEFLKDIKRHVDYLLEVLDNLEDLLKIEKDRIKLNPKKTDLFVVYSGLKNIYQNVLEFNKNIELEFSFPYEPLPEVFVDRAKLKLIMINLINTAIAHLGEGRIAVNVVNDFKKSNVQTTIEAAYSGESSDDVLFDRFSELFKSKEKMSGLGLEKTKKIIESMNGVFSFESHDEGRVVAAKFTTPIFTMKKTPQTVEIE